MRSGAVSIRTLSRETLPPCALCRGSFDSITDINEKGATFCSSTYGRTSAAADDDGADAGSALRCSVQYQYFFHMPCLLLYHAFPLLRSSAPAAFSAHLVALVLLKEEIMTRPSSSTSMPSSEKSSMIWRMILPPGPMICDFSCPGLRREQRTKESKATQSNNNNNNNFIPDEHCPEIDTAAIWVV